MRNLRLYPVKTRLLTVGDDLAGEILDSLKKQDLELEENDILALTSKLVSCSEGRIVKLSDVKPSKQAKKFSEKYSLRPEFTEVILREADRVYGGVEKAILTLKTGIMAANAGVDNKNAPADSVVLLPKNVTSTARRIRAQIKKRIGIQVAVLIIDSGLVPLRKGTTGLALAVAGFKPVRDCRGESDLYGKPIIITRHAIADDLASAAHSLIGEGSERTPVVLIKDAIVDFGEGVYGSADMMLPFKECIFMNQTHLR